MLKEGRKLMVNVSEHISVKFRFKEFRVYQAVKEYCRYSRDVVGEQVRMRDSGLASQIQRALNSIVLNIAEGSADHSDAEFARFLGISIRSLYESVAGFDLAAHYGYIDPDLNREIEERAHALVKQLASFRNTLKHKRNSTELNFTGSL